MGTEERITTETVQGVFSSVARSSGSSYFVAWEHRVPFGFGFQGDIRGALLNVDAEGAVADPITILQINTEPAPVSSSLPSVCFINSKNLVVYQNNWHFKLRFNMISFQ
jgi:hypothetical protein